MKASELRDLSPEELLAKSNELRGEVFNAKVRLATGQLTSRSAVATASGPERWI